MLSSSTQQRCSVLLHFSGYGYDKRGLCNWLLHALRDAQQRLGPRLRIVTLFHELSASSPPWQSAFWLGPMQARIARQLAALSAAVATNTAQHAQWLRAQAGVSLAVQFPVHVRPVFSNFPQPPQRPAIAAREPAMIVFGSAATRARALRRLAAHAAMLQSLGIESLTEVGPGAQSVHPSHPLPQQQLGTLLPADVSRQLLRHRYALIDYPSHCLAKSSVFAAYAAHGCAVLNTADPEPDADALRAGQHYAALAATAPVDAEAWQAMADALSGWYAGHPLDLQAQELGELMDPAHAGQPRC